MSYMPLTPFRRTDEAVQYSAPSCDQKRDRIAPVDKWDALRELAICRKDFGLNDRDLTVLQALLSFHPKRELTDNALRQVVFASNNSLCERLNGMPCSTMRRHLAKLVSAGVIRRRDSPNGKRYTRRYGPVRIAFGFDITPLALLYPRLCKVAEQRRQEESERHALREEAFLRRRDLIALLPMTSDYLAYEQQTNIQGLIESSGKALRRKLDHDQLTAIVHALSKELEAMASFLENEVSTNDRQIEHHHDTSKTEDSSQAVRQLEDKQSTSSSTDSVTNAPKGEKILRIEQILLDFPEASVYAGQNIRSEAELLRFTNYLYPMMGIKQSVWQKVLKSHGLTLSSAMLFAVLERFGEISDHDQALLYCSESLPKSSVCLKKINDCIERFLMRCSQL